MWGRESVLVAGAAAAAAAAAAVPVVSLMPRLEKVRAKELQAWCLEVASSVPGNYKLGA